MDIILTTVNATYQHASLGLRYLLANMGDLRPKTALLEFTLSEDPKTIAESILKSKPKVLGVGVYIWNVEKVERVLQVLKSVVPDLFIVVGGPEVSFEAKSSRIAEIADCVLSGEGDEAFAQICRRVMSNAPVEKWVKASLPDLFRLNLPYPEYTDEDLKNRFTYVEASRGCAYRCEFCLSARDEKVRYFTDAFLESLDDLFHRGARHFKFVDRTFNLHPARARAVLEFFLKRLKPDLHLHFEMVPDRFPDELKDLIQRFPPGVVQFEVGIQTWNPEVARRISRPQNYQAIEGNLNFLRGRTHVHLHADLIVGLPGETLESFGRGFDALFRLKPHEIQVGILKRLKGAPHTARDAENRYESAPPYRVLSTPSMTFSEIQRLSRFAKFWDLVGNSGNFNHTVRLMSCSIESVFEEFFSLSNFLAERHPQPWGVALPNLFRSVWSYFCGRPYLDRTELCKAMVDDFSLGGRRDVPLFLTDAMENDVFDATTRTSRRLAKRQVRHQGNRPGTC